MNQTNEIRIQIWHKTLFLKENIITSIQNIKKTRLYKGETAKNHTKRSEASLSELILKLNNLDSKYI